MLSAAAEVSLLLSAEADPLLFVFPHAAMENIIAAAKDAAASFFKNLFFILH